MPGRDDVLVTTEWVADHLSYPSVKLIEVDVVALTRFSGHLDCSEMLAQKGVQDGQTISTRVPPAGGGAGAAA